MGTQIILHGTGMSPGKAVGVCALAPSCGAMPPGSAGRGESGPAHRAVWITPRLTAVDAARLEHSAVSGVVVERSPAASHGIIVARSLGIPVIQVPDALRHIAQGQRVAIDADAGILYTRPGSRISARFAAYVPPASTAVISPFPMSDGVPLHLFASAATAAEAERAYAVGASGVGMYRTETEYLRRAQAPDEDELTGIYADVAARMKGKPVFFRTMDLGGDKVPAYLDAGREENPMLGLRGIRFSLKHRELLLTQVRALLRAAALGEVAISFPMVTTYEEWRCAKGLVEEAAAGLKAQGIRHRGEVPVGLTIETPAASLMADLFTREAAFILIGLNDLSAYTMAVDRGNAGVSEIAQGVQPPLLKLLDYVCSRAWSAHTPVMLCGEMARRPEYLPIWVGLGIRRLCVDAADMPMLVQAAHALRVPECRAAFQRALAVHAARPARRVVRARI